MPGRLPPLQTRATMGPGGAHASAGDPARPAQEAGLAALALARAGQHAAVLVGELADLRLALVPADGLRRLMPDDAIDEQPVRALEALDGGNGLRTELAVGGGADLALHGAHV